MKAGRSLLCVALSSALLSACAEPVTRNTAPLTPRLPAPTKAGKLPISWGIPRFFEVGRAVQLEAGGRALDTTGWPGAVFRASSDTPRAYLSAAFDNRNRVFVWADPDPDQGVRRYALVVPEPKTFSTNGVVTAYWGPNPSLMNFAPGAVRSFATFTRTTPANTERVIPVRAQLEPTGVNPQELENVYQLEDSQLAVFEHKGLVPGEPLSFLEFTIYDRDTVTDDTEPEAINATSAPGALNVALTPLREEEFSHRHSFESAGYRVVAVSNAPGQSYFLATPSELRPRWGFGEASTDLTLGPLEPSEGRDAGPGSAAALVLEHPTRGWFLSGTVHDESEIPALLERGAAFRTQMQMARRELLAGATQDVAARAARAFLDAHRSQVDRGSLTRFAHGDAKQPSNGAAFLAGVRYGRDGGSALRGLIAVQRTRPDTALLKEIAELASFTLSAMLPSGATFAQRVDQLAMSAEHDEINGRSDVFIDNGSLAVAVNHRRLLLASTQTHAPALTWGAFGATIDGQSSTIDQARYQFSIDGESLPRGVSADDRELSVARLFTPDSSPIRIRETAELQRKFPALIVRYQCENRGARPSTVSEARLTLADFLDYGTGSNERSQGRYGLGHVADGVRVPVGFWMEGMKAPLWSDSLDPGELDLTEQYHRLGSHFLLVFGFDRAQIFSLSRPADRLLLSTSKGGLSRLEARYRVDTTLAPGQTYVLPAAFSYTLRAPLASTDGDLVPDQLQELAPLWTRLVSSEASADSAAPPSLDTDSGHAELVYAWILSAELLESSASSPSFPELAARLKRSALRGASFALGTFGELRNRTDFLPTYANGHDYGFHMAIFDWAYRQTCDTRYREAFLMLASDLVRSDQRGGLQISDPQNPSYGGYLSTQQARASGVTLVGDQGIRLWALRIAYERTGASMYRRSAQLFLDHWLRLDPVTRSFTGTVFSAQRYRDADVEQERSPLGQYAMLAGLKAWSDVLPSAKRLYLAGLSAATGRHVVHRVGLSGPRRLLVPSAGLADFSDEAELDGSFLWAMTFEPSTLRGRFTPQCRRAAQLLTSATGSN